MALPGNPLAPPRRRRQLGPARSLIAKRLGTPRAAPAGPGFRPATNPFDYTADPTYQRIKGLTGQRVGAAEADALQARKQLAIDYGDASLAPDEASKAAALANPHSIMASLARNRVEQPKKLTENLNNQNLFYSTAANRQQSDLVRQLSAADAEAASGVRSRLGEIESGLMGARQSAAQDDLSAEEDAAGRLRERLGDQPVGYQGLGSARAVTGGPASLIRRRLMQPRRPRRPRPAPGNPGNFA